MVSQHFPSNPVFIMNAFINASVEYVVQDVITCGTLEGETENLASLPINPAFIRHYNCFYIEYTAPRLYERYINK